LRRSWRSPAWLQPRGPTTPGCGGRPQRLKPSGRRCVKTDAWAATSTCA
jgi:hypothetical protein